MFKFYHDHCWSINARWFPTEETKGYSEQIGLSEADLYGAVSFYTFYTAPQNDNIGQPRSKVDCQCGESTYSHKIVHIMLIRHNVHDNLTNIAICMTSLRPEWVYVILEMQET